MNIKVLFLSANPSGSVELKLTNEIYEIRSSIRRVPVKNKILLEENIHITYGEIRRKIINFKPDILHFSGHGTSDSLCIENEKGETVKLKGEVLKELLELFSGVECVILNSCYSEKQARLIAKTIPITIGMSNRIEDDLAIQFSSSFYEAMKNNNDIEKAFKIGVNSMKSKVLIESKIVDYRTLGVNGGISENIVLLIKGGNYKSFSRKIKKFTIKNFRKITTIIIIFIIMFFLYLFVLKISNEAKLLLYKDSYDILREKNTQVMTEENYSKNIYIVMDLKVDIPKAIKNIAGLNKYKFNDKYKILKYEVLSELYLMQSGLFVRDYLAEEKQEVKNEAITNIKKSIEFSEKLTKLLSMNNYKLISKDFKKERTMYNLSTSYAMLVSLGLFNYKNDLEKNYYGVPLPYRKKYPYENDYFLKIYFDGE